MLGWHKTIPTNSVCFCSTEILKGKEKNQRFIAATGKVAVISILDGPAILREVNFDGTVLNIKAWNTGVRNQNFPITLELVQLIQDIDTSKYFGETVCVSNVEIFAITNRVYIDF